VIGKGTGIAILEHELLGGAATVAAKLRSQIQGQTNWQQVKAELREH
jgi:hypothetical protein